MHALVDALPDTAADLSAAEQALSDPAVRRIVSMLLHTPEGEPPLSGEEARGLLEAFREVARGEEIEFDNVEDAIAWLDGRNA